MPKTPAFVFTTVAFLAALGVSWANRDWVVGVWLSPALDAASRTGIDPLLRDPAGLAAVTPRLTFATALLLTFPVLCAEAWLLVCRLAKREQARRLAVPFSVASAGAVLLAVWVARQVDAFHFVILL